MRFGLPSLLFLLLYAPIASGKNAKPASPDQVFAATNEANRRHEESLSLDCYNTSFSSHEYEEALNFYREYRFRFEGGRSEFSKGHAIFTGRLVSTIGTIQITLAIRQENNRSLYTFSIQNESGVSVSSSGDRADGSITVPARSSVNDVAFLNLYDKLRLQSLYCSVGTNDSFAFGAKDITSTFHLSVHPHTKYDPNRKLVSEINAWERKKGVRSLVLLEAQAGRNFTEILAGVPYQPADPKLTFVPLPNTRFAMAPNGTMPYRPFHGRLPERFIFTGGWFDACMSHATHDLLAALRQAKNTQRIFIGLPMKGIAAVSITQFQPSVSYETTLSELRKSRPEAFSELMEIFLSEKLTTWREEEPLRAAIEGDSPRGLEIELKDELGQTILQKSWGEPGMARVQVTFQLL